MNGSEQNPGGVTEVPAQNCEESRGNFSAYLDGALDGRAMAQLAGHLDSCSDCDREFSAWRSMHTALGELGQAPVPRELQAQLRDTLAGELDRGSYLPPLQRFAALWQRTLMPTGLRLSAGLGATLLLLGGLSWLVGSVAPVQANDDRLAHLNAPQYLYSVTPPVPISTHSRFVAVLVDAKVNAQGRVYDYDLVEGPDDAKTRTWIESNLLGSVFKPATVFGVPVPGHAVMTYTAVSVRG